LHGSAIRGTVADAIYPAMGNHSLKSLALACKILGIVVSVVIPVLIFHPRWGVSLIADVQIVGLAVLALIPNRWLVFSRISFAISLLLTLFPFHDLLRASVYRGVGPGIAGVGILVATLLYAPLPLSLVLSRMRLQKGDRFAFA
jgi:hypothetical protein